MKTDTYKPKRLRKIRKIGNSFYIKLCPSDIIDYQIPPKKLNKIIVDISDIIFIKYKNEL